MTDAPAVPEPTTATVESADGTSIGYLKLGSGAPIVLVHGSISTAETWLAVAAELAADHAVYVFDRRGRGRSGDADAYTLTTETEDINAVLAVAAEQTGATPALLGHSYGAICVLEAVRTGADVASVVLYEPPLPVDGPTAGVHLRDYADAVDAGDYDRAMRVAAQHFLRISQDETDGLAATPLWPQFLALTPTWTRELAAIDATDSLIGEYAALPDRTLLLVGGESPSHLVGASTYLKNNLPNATEVVFEGHGHFANLMDPAGVAESIRTFVDG
ncbi:alpha/beta hydrolase [Gordonia sp. TBRC 11910]|uniref:Alpha/beta hydrolase n=1 Tax=Gordonia asplenii TaxID=2725283 RepID=A0A848KR57_9ACTN|nr:alpha/beta hydrolase [Gordonia asplenii]NMO00417.1 alpha/beta hydrolase [Gordonia asplenii]